MGIIKKKRKRPHQKFIEKKGAEAQFVAQGLSSAQKMYGLGKSRGPGPGLDLTATLKREKGMSLYGIINSPGGAKYLKKRINTLAKLFGRALGEHHLKRGVLHGDLYLKNILLKEDKQKNIKLKFIDYEFATSLDLRKRTLFGPPDPFRFKGKEIRTVSKPNKIKVEDFASDFNSFKEVLFELDIPERLKGKYLKTFEEAYKNTI